MTVWIHFSLRIWCPEIQWIQWWHFSHDLMARCWVNNIQVANNHESVPRIIPLLYQSSHFPFWLYMIICIYIYIYPIDDPFPHVSLVPSRQGCEKAMRLAKEGVKLSIRGPAGEKDMAWDSLLSSFFSHFDDWIGWISGVFKDLLVLDGYRMVHLRQFADVWCRLSRHVLNCWQFFLRDVWIYHAQTSSPVDWFAFWGLEDRYAECMGNYWVTFSASSSTGGWYAKSDW